MSTTLRLDVVSAEKALFSGEALMVVVQGELGEMGIAPGHAQLLTTLKPGSVRVVLADGNEESFYVGSGLLEVQPYIVTILADTAMRAKDLDEAKVLQIKAQAEEVLAKKTSHTDFARASAELAEALAQIRTIQKIRKRVK